jgi:hypothetical protein
MTTVRTTRKPGRKTGRTSGRAPGSRNKVLHTRRVRLPIGWTLMLAMLVVGAVAYLLLCTRTEALGRQIRAEELEIEQLRRRVASEEVRWSEMIGPRRLEEALRRHRLVMNYPAAHQIVHIRDMALWESGQGPVEMVGQLDRADGGFMRQ